MRLKRVFGLVVIMCLITMDNCVQASDVQELVDIFDLVSENKVDLKRCKELREDYD